MSEHPHVELAEQYAGDVLGGRMDACRWVKLPLERHRHDLKESKRKTFPYTFDPARGERVCRFIECLPHVKDDWAARKELIRLEPWQCSILTTVFGWVRKDTGQRRFRRVYVEVPRKNAKSTIGAGVGLYCFAADGVHGAEVYSGATSEKQAWEVFRPARLMALRTPEFCEAYGVEVGAKNLHIPSTGSRFEPVIGKPGDGASPSCAIIDEYHEHDTDSLFDTMVTGMGARAMAGSPLLLVITTAGDNIAGPCYALHDDVKKILEGNLEGDTTFGIIYTLDEGDDWTTEEATRKANPNYGVSVSPTFLSDERKLAIADARKQGVYKTKHDNIWVTSRSAWMNMEGWKRCENLQLRLEDCVGLPCLMGLDMAPKTDFCSAVFLFKDGDRYKALAKHFLPEKTALDPTKQHYTSWAHAGRIVTAGEFELEFRQVEDVLVPLVNQARPRELAYDAVYGIWTAQGLAERCGVTPVEMPMGVAKTFTAAMFELDAAVASGRFEHDGDPVLAWMISNVVARIDARGNLYPRKERYENKIDGAVALLLAVACAIAGRDVGSVYDTRGALVL